MRNKVILVPYDYSWEDLYRKEVYRIQNLLEENFITGYHIGSTSVLDLISKPTIDLLVVVKDIMKVNTCNDGMIRLGYESKGQYGIPFRRYFPKKGMLRSYHVHVYEQGNLNIDRHLLFRDYLRVHLKEKETYTNLKIKLAKMYMDNSYAYCCGKEIFIQEIIKKSGFNGCLLVEVTTPFAQQQYDRIYKNKGFDANFTHSFNLPFFQHKLMALIQGTKFIGVASVYILEKKQAIFESIVMDMKYQYERYESKFLQLIEQWINQQDRKLIRSSGNHYIV